MAWRRIQIGEVGIVLHRGAFTDRILMPGTHWLTPFIDSVVTISTKEHTYEVIEESLIGNIDADFSDHPLDARTADGVGAEILYSVRFFVAPKDARLVLERFGSLENVTRAVVKAESRQIVRQTLSQHGFSAKDLVGQPLHEVQEKMTNALRAKLASNGITMTFFGLRAINLGEYGRLIEDQKKAEEQLRKEKADTEIVLEQQRRQELVEESEARRQADRVKAEASAAAEAEKIRAVQAAESRLEVARREAELEKIRVAAAAEAKRIEAEADARVQELRTIAEADGKRRLAEVEADAQKLLASVVNSELIQWRRIEAEVKQAERWDGKLPLLSGLKAFSFLDLATVVGGGDTPDKK